jgi:hypothetical protein
MIERDEIVAVTEADREAAADAMSRVWVNGQHHSDFVRILDGRLDEHWSVQAFARHRATHAGEVERGREENEALKKRGTELVIAYHVAICSPKGVVPDDRFYDPAIAAKVQDGLERARQALEASR